MWRVEFEGVGWPDRWRWYRWSGITGVISNAATDLSLGRI